MPVAFKKYTNPQTLMPYKKAAASPLRTSLRTMLHHSTFLKSPIAAWAKVGFLALAIGRLPKFSVGLPYYMGPRIQSEYDNSSLNAIMSF
ncbi:MAG TPA: hypothetical protein VMW40_05280 [Candidatus Bathyarchaeia archaeon]|nr:hypothetical protein [Candidatus Bathyarchaeia archaeon]